jgi:triosephosphate isomerase
VNPLLRKPCVVANWKMQGSFAIIEDFLRNLAKNMVNFSSLEIIFCPPVVYIDAVKKLILKEEVLHPIKLGAQNTHDEQQGAFTGEISPVMLKEIGCDYVLVGHSERRALFHEDDTLVARKALAAYHANLIPILCVGETAKEREDGKTFEVLSRQLEVVLQKLPAKLLQTAILAYEPIWAIGTGLALAPEAAAAVNVYLREWLSQYDEGVGRLMRILYGGSVKTNNAKHLFAIGNMDGALVGNASLQAETFLTICMDAVNIANQ